MRVISIFLLCVIGTIQTVKTEGELLAVSMMYRHGDRTPMKFYPNDPYKDAPFWPAPPGELTNVGKNQHYELGQWLRKRYDGFLSPIYNKSEIYIRSSDRDRCIMSAASNLAGLYPPNGKDVWMNDLPWQPIPIHTVPVNNDDMITIGQSCMKYNILVSEIRKLPYFKDIDRKNKDLYKYMSENSGMKVSDFRSASSIYSILYTETQFNLSLPIWTVNVYPQMQNIHNIARTVYIYTPETMRFSIGRIFDNIISQFDHFLEEDAASISNITEKFRIFSVHDYNIYAVLKALKFEHFEMIPYAATVIFELRKSEKGKAYVQVLYKTTVDQVEEVQIGDCGLECEVGKFKDFVKPISLTQEEFWKECQT